MVESIEVPLDDAPLDAFLQKRQRFPRAAFPPRLLLPDDLDNLCRIRSTHHAFVPVRFEDMCVRQVWDDGCGTEKLFLLPEQFVRAFVACTESEMEQVAAAWASTFPSDGSLSFTLPYQALLQLQAVAHDAMNNKRSLLSHREGVPHFFTYLRTLQD